MRNLLLAGLFAIILFAGCISLPWQQSSEGQTNKVSPQSEPTPHQQSTASSAPAEENATPPKTDEESIEAQVKNLADAFSLSLPVECTIQATTPTNVPITVHYWIKEGKARAEFAVPNSGTAVVIKKDNKVYVHIPTMPMGRNDCAWLMFEEKVEEGGIEEESENREYSRYVEVYKQPENIKVRCHLSVITDDKFATPGKVCTLSDLLPPQVNLPPGYEACKGLSGQALLTCLQNVQRQQ